LAIGNWSLKSRREIVFSRMTINNTQLDIFQVKE
jgi:hypothetical protein